MLLQPLQLYHLQQLSRSCIRKQQCKMMKRSINSFYLLIPGKTDFFDTNCCLICKIWGSAYLTVYYQHHRYILPIDESKRVDYLLYREYRIPRSQTAEQG